MSLILHTLEEEKYCICWLLLKAAKSGLFYIGMLGFKFWHLRTH